MLNVDLEFQTNFDIEVLITDLKGKIIKKKIINNFLKGQVLFDLTDIKNGAYNCSIITEETVYNKSILIIK